MKRSDGESERQYIWRLATAMEDGRLDMNWTLLADVLNRELHDDAPLAESTYRKAYQAARSYYDEVFLPMMAEQDGTDTVRERIRLMQKEQMKLQTEKLEYNRWLRENAREELIAEHIAQAIRSLPPLAIPTHISPRHSGRFGSLIISDPHYGKELCIKGLYGETINEYSPEIFERRMWSLLGQVVEICKKERFDTLNVYDLGDEIEGMLRVGDLMKLKYGVLESAVLYGRFITEWLNELTRYVRVRYQMVKDSNHCQLRLLGQVKNTFRDENVSVVITEKIMDRLGENSNFEFVQNPTGYIFDKVGGYTIFGYHGEGKGMDRAIKDFSRTYRTPIDYMIGGHKHHKNVENVGIESDVISVPSIIGVDDFSLSLSKLSDPGALLFVIEEGKGNVIEYNIKL